MKNAIKTTTIEKLLGKVIKNERVEFSQMSTGDKGKIVFHNVSQKDYRKSKRKLENMLRMRGLDKLDCYRVSASYKDKKYRMSLYVNNFSVVQSAVGA